MVLDDSFQEAGVHGSQDVLRCSQFSIHCLILLIEDQLYITAVNHLCIPVSAGVVMSHQGFLARRQPKMTILYG